MEQKLLGYACEQFESGAYDAALEAFILLYTRGYEREWVLENIYNCYMAGNEAEFRKNFEHWNTRDKLPYEECILDFIPYREGEYYIYDKEIQEFRGIFSTNRMKNVTRQEDFRQMEFSALAVAMYWDWRDLPGILEEARYHKVYAVCQDMNRCASFFKIPELSGYASNIMLFSNTEEFQYYFHEHTSVYLPKLCAEIENEKKTLLEIINQEHEYRLTPEGRSTDNVLLTIAIPTYGRGNLVLERMKNLLQMSYDAEIEIAISKNGMESYQKEYQQVSQIPDARMIYYDHEKTIWPTENWRYVVGMSHGKYVLFVSDEDDVVLPALEHYLRLLTDYPDVNVVRAKTMFQYSYISARSYGKKGLDAFKYSFLSQNYLSGLIVRREDFIKEDFASLERFSENEFYMYYPHGWWCAVLSQKGDNLFEPVVLVQEGDAVMQPEGQGALPKYATYDARMKQFRGIVEFLHWMMDENPEGAFLGLEVAIRKTLHLFRGARIYRYDIEHYEEWIDRFCGQVIDAIDEFILKEQQKMELLQELQFHCRNLLKEHEQLIAQEAGV